ncbi:aldehyde dehydrogenase family-domain-containing protein [Lipomyces doorenjongii]
METEAGNNEKRKTIVRYNKVISENLVILASIETKLSKTAKTYLVPSVTSVIGLTRSMARLRDFPRNLQLHQAGTRRCLQTDYTMNVLLIMWVMKVGFAIACSNTVILKTAEKHSAKAGFPPGIINILSGFGRTAGPVFTSRRVSMTRIFYCAIKKGNSTKYGLASAVHTRSLNIAIEVAHKLRAGTVWVNCYNALHWALLLGGYGKSSFGRENGKEALREYTQTKAVNINLSYLKFGKSMETTMEFVSWFHRDGVFVNWHNNNVCKGRKRNVFTQEFVIMQISFM